LVQGQGLGPGDEEPWSTERPSNWPRVGEGHQAQVPSTIDPRDRGEEAGETRLWSPTTSHLESRSWTRDERGVFEQALKKFKDILPGEEEEKAPDLAALGKLLPSRSMAEVVEYFYVGRRRPMGRLVKWIVRNTVAADSRSRSAKRRRRETVRQQEGIRKWLKLRRVRGRYPLSKMIDFDDVMCCRTTDEEEEADSVQG